MEVPAHILEARKRLANRGKPAGGLRRKRKTAPVQTSSVDKRLQAQLKKMHADSLIGIEEVNLFKNDGDVIHFVNPKVQGSAESNTYVVSGSAETKPLQDLLPDIISQLGTQNLDALRQMVSSMPGAPTEGAEEEVPELVENFDSVDE